VHPDQIQNGNCQSIGHVVLDNSGGASDAEGEESLVRTRDGRAVQE